MTSDLAGRVDALPDSTILPLQERVLAARAAGRPVVGFAAGEPGAPTPDVVVEAAARAARDPRLQHYGPTAGLPDLREKVATQASHTAAAQVRVEQVVITTGAKQALALSLQALIDPGDDVLLPTPLWPGEIAAVTLTGGRAVLVPTHLHDGWQPTIDALERARTPRTKALVLTSPSNPTGALLDRQRLGEIGAWARRAGVWLLADELYAPLVYDGHEHVSLLTVAPDLADTAAVIGGVSKAFAMTGWRVGWIIGPRALAIAVRRLQEATTTHPAGIAQAAALAALEHAPQLLPRTRVQYALRRQRLCDALDQLPGIACPHPAGAFYAFPSAAGLLGARLGGRTITAACDLADVLLDEADVAVVPGDAFAGPTDHLRLSFALPDDELLEGIDRITALLEDARSP